MNVMLPDHQSTTPVDDLFARVKAGLDREDDDNAWQAINGLRSLGSVEVLELAIDLTKDENPLLRARGAAILGQLGIPNRTFPEACFTAIAPLVLNDQDPEVLKDAITALGHLKDRRSTTIVVSHVAHEHADVRFAVAFALGGCSETPATDALIALTRDGDEDVRNWATFGLGELGTGDTPEIRQALFERLQDVHKETRYEAICGLARCKDTRVLPLIISILKGDPSDPSLEEHAKNWLKIESENIARESLIEGLERLQTYPIA